MVGFSGRERDGSESKAFVWNYQTGMINIGTLGGPYAQAIRDQRRWVHNGHVPNRGYVCDDPRVYLSGGCASGQVAMRDLGVLGGLSSYGMAINGNNHVAGYSTRQANDERVHAFLHDGKSMIDLGSLGAKGTETDVSAALGVNNLARAIFAKQKTRNVEHETSSSAY